MASKRKPSPFLRCACSCGCIKSTTMGICKLCRNNQHFQKFGNRKSSTHTLIEQLRPMMNRSSLAQYEKNKLEIFDVTYRHKEDTSTLWGPAKLQWSMTDLQSLNNNTFDYLMDEYEMWIRETPKFENGPNFITDEKIRYAISSVAHNFGRDAEFIFIKCQRVSGCLVLSLDFYARENQIRKFYKEFGL